LLALAVVGAVIAWEVRSILISDVPRLRAVQTVAVGVPMLLLVFASVYVQIETSQPNSFSETLSRTDALYFTVTVFSTVGFGDIAPKSELARIVTMSQMLTGLIVLGLVAKVVFGAVQTAVARREGAAAVRPTAPGRDDTQQPDARADPQPHARRMSVHWPVALTITRRFLVAPAWPLGVDRLCLRSRITALTPPTSLPLPHRRALLGCCAGWSRTGRIHYPRRNDGSDR
jgi:hypothetical protein